MAKSRAAMIRGALGAAWMAAAVGCGAAQRPPAVDQQATSGESTQEPALGPPPACVDQHDRPVTCLSDADCCANFVCGKDPELNPRESYCLFAG